MEKKIIALFVLTALLLMGCGQQQVSSDTIKVGAVAPLTGDVSDWGDVLAKSIKLAVEEANAEGGVNGSKIELFTENGKCLGKEAASATNKLLHVDNVDALTGFLCSSELLGAAPIAEEEKTVMIGSGSSPKISEAGDYIFRSWPSDAGQAKVMAEHVYEKGIRKVALIYTNSDYNLALADAFKKNFEALGGEIVARETYKQGSSDFRTQVTKIKNSNPEAVFMVTYSEGGLLMRQIREAGLEVPMFGSDVSGSEQVLKDAGNAAEGVVYGTVKFDKEAKKTQEFINNFQERYGEEPTPLIAAVHGYDAMKLLAKGMGEVGTDSEALKEWLYDVEDYEGASGTFSINEKGDPIKEFQLFKIINGTPKEHNPGGQ